MTVEKSLESVSDIEKFREWCSSATIDDLEYLLGHYSGQNKYLLRTKMIPRVANAVSNYKFSDIINIELLDRILLNPTIHEDDV